MSTQLTQDEVLKVASLSRLKLSETEVTALGEQMGSVLKYIAMLDELDTADIEPMAHAIEISNVFRDDQLQESLPREQALSNAPQTDGNYFLVPAIL
ncbi:Asp-tRNA(Asn)/Glu-tRNA(Gln) amidotransferase subunit GatC [Gimesia maris]|jgi:aspartyl-tRNA(Asn)/glutamyl-tRNA(Gln) amidotransferase subunit C|uniref:Aspartyl/glutamyl-tRNA(Asn/Gln) amidotransferase subunit C n=1 Tax=Gimesia maris TaxID=122 RepID=A0A3D3R9Q3_9PLAN|nr:Asp-tRNA(Asn)/Glu-tRNA(Gln) amidotransferase subunit GatC [Gimesia maris]QDT77751.1 Glutamyl-tRNA(Gln) amidotransferase subunit C [Gimesia maris]QDU13414.1 Glutamyl-tRNA(Gln) amidotransferase subunit C [Gimesia maris]HAW29837.1 Asp-tRNA(Asn)/Glu-tRNA(Gln) amidotransferase GatCAB subunit C [Planctomycetaceae bacterium]HCO25604.1 Asp-tRNA(Asn)/Glu-tRNA(Gln) amidotransferase GatCAB subunit C [Gimesia maris]|tara:strand:- start:3155 stop:3445 length:291 start_codon:yes stop_codon:yes gene_type:complete